MLVITQFYLVRASESQQQQLLEKIRATEVMYFLRYMANGNLLAISID